MFKQSSLKESAMKRGLTAVLSLVMIAGSTTVFTGCGGHRPHETQVAGVALPDWFNDPFKDDQFGAVGLARKSLGGMQEQLNKAMAQGRTELARTISTKVQAAYTSFFTEGGEAGWGENGEVVRNELAQEMSENVSRQITDQVLQGARRKDTWIHPKNEDLYVWVVIDNSMRDVLAQQIKASARKEVAAKAQVKAELKAKDALSRLDAAIDKELARQAGGVQ